MNTSTVDIFKLVPCSDELSEECLPHTVSTDYYKDIPMLCVRLFRAAGMWTITITDERFEELATKDFEDDSYTEEYMALMNAMSVFNNIHKVETLLQLKNIGFTV